MAAAWPYYSLVDLLTENASRYSASQLPMYQSVALRIFPAVVALPLLYRRFRKDRRDPLVVAFVLLVAAYGYGGISGNYNFGRLISYIVLLAHVQIAAWLAMFGPTLVLTLRRRPLSSLAISLLLAIALVANMAHGLARSIPRSLLPARYRQAPEWKTYQHVLEGIPRTTVTMATLSSGRYVPTFGGKIVGSQFPSSFISDDAARRRAVHRFFAPNISNSERRTILVRYRVDYILVDRTDRKQSALLPKLASVGRLSRVVGSLSLIKVAKRHTPDVAGLGAARTACSRQLQLRR